MSLYIYRWSFWRTPWEASVFSPGQTPRISPGLSGCHGWAGSLTSLADVSFKGAGGGNGGVKLSVGIIRSSCSLVSPERDMCEGNANVAPLRARSAVCKNWRWSIVGLGSVLNVEVCGLDVQSPRQNNVFYRSRNIFSEEIGPWNALGVGEK